MKSEAGLKPTYVKRGTQRFRLFGQFLYADLQRLVIIK